MGRGVVFGGGGWVGGVRTRGAGNEWDPSYRLLLFHAGASAAAPGRHRVAVSAGRVPAGGARCGGRRRGRGERTHRGREKNKGFGIPGARWYRPLQEGCAQAGAHRIPRPRAHKPARADAPSETAPRGAAPRSSLLLALCPGPRLRCRSSSRQRWARYSAPAATASVRPPLRGLSAAAAAAVLPPGAPPLPGTSVDARTNSAAPGSASK
jgi:hypothetical protein